ncbi:MAG: hypothetical protein WBG41_05470 [Acidimicrobiales bacterium]
MSAISGSDRLIVATVLAVLLGLFGLGLAQRSQDTRPRPPSAADRALAPVPSPAAAATLPGSPTTSTFGTAGTVVGSGTGSDTSSATSSASGVPSPPVPGPFLAVGDSLMIDIQPYLEADLPGVTVDGMVSRQFEAGIAVVQTARAAGRLGNVLVVELGTNGSVTSSDVDAMMQAAAGVRRVVFVNVDVPRSWETADNAALAAGVARYPGVAVLADWYSLSNDHPAWFDPDQVHLQPAGAQAMAALIASDA